MSKKLSSKDQQVDLYAHAFQYLNHIGILAFQQMCSGSKLYKGAGNAQSGVVGKLFSSVSYKLREFDLALSRYSLQL